MTLARTMASIEEEDRDLAGEFFASLSKGSCKADTRSTSQDRKTEAPIMKRTRP